MVSCSWERSSLLATWSVTSWTPVSVTQPAAAAPVASTLSAASWVAVNPAGRLRLLVTAGTW